MPNGNGDFDTRDPRHHPAERKTDKSKVAKVTSYLDRFPVIATAIISGLFWLTAQFLVPVGRIQKVEGSVDTVRESVQSIERDSIPAIRGEQKGITERIDVLVRLQCFDPRINERDRLLAGLDCEGVIRGQYRVRSR